LKKKIKSEDNFIAHRSFTS